MSEPINDKYAALNPGLGSDTPLAKGCGNCDAGPEYMQVPSCADDSNFDSVKPDSTQSTANY